MSINKEMKRKILSAVAFQICWFVSVLGPAHGSVWVGPGIVGSSWLIHIVTSRRRKSIVGLTMVCVVLGFFVDTAFIWFGIYVPAQMGEGIASPVWLVFMWINLALLMNESMRWLQGKYLLSSVLGAIGGASSYVAGGSFGGIVIHAPLYLHLIFIAAAWAFILPLLVWSIHNSVDCVSGKIDSL